MLRFATTRIFACVWFFCLGPWASAQLLRVPGDLFREPADGGFVRQVAAFVSSGDESDDSESAPQPQTRATPETESDPDSDVEPQDVEPQRVPELTADPSPASQTMMASANGNAGSLQSFQLDEFGRSPHLQISNNFNVDPLFDSGIVITRGDVALKIGGYVKADLIHDFDPIETPDSFVTTAIPTSGPDYENSNFHARQSRLSFDTRWKVNGKVARAFIEGDFFGGETNGTSLFRLRHAYGHLGRFTAGQTWTTFTDPSAVPPTLDTEGAVSNVNRRQGLVRWDQPLPFDGLSFALAVEDPRIIIEAPPMFMGQGRTESPDFHTRLRYEQDWGEFQSSFVLRKLGIQPVGQDVISEMAWGFNFTGSFLVVEDTKAYYQITFGEGIGSYRGSPDVVVTGPMTGEILPMFGWMVGVHHQWTDSLTSNVTFSQLALDDIPGQDPDNLLGTTYLAVNLIANPYERVFVGVEYLYGIREDVSGASGDAHRLQMSFGFYLP